MKGRRTRRDPDADVSQDTSGLGRFEVRSVLGWLALLVGAVPFLLLWLLVQENWSPLASLDGEVAAALNGSVSRSPMAVGAFRLVTDLGGTGTAVLVLTLTTLFLLIRSRRRLAAYVATTGIGLAVLGQFTAEGGLGRTDILDPVDSTPLRTRRWRPFTCSRTGSPPKEGTSHCSTEPAPVVTEGLTQSPNLESARSAQRHMVTPWAGWCDRRDEEMQLGVPRDR